MIVLVSNSLIDPSLTIFKRVDEIRETRANDLGRGDEAVARGARRTKEGKGRGNEIGRD